MGNLESWMDEQTIMELFKENNFNPKSVQLIKNKNKGNTKSFCFIDFFSINEANDALTILNGKKITINNLVFNLKWANSNSKNIDIFVGNLSPEIDNITLYNLFNEKYPSVHHVFIITNKDKISKGYGYINFLNKEESENCIKEMNGYIFYNRALKIEEKRNNNQKKIENISQIKTEEKVKKEEKKENDTKEEMKEGTFEFLYRINEENDTEEEMEKKIYFVCPSRRKEENDTKEKMVEEKYKFLYIRKEEIDTEKKEENEEEEEEIEEENEEEEEIGKKEKKNCINETFGDLTIEFIGILKCHTGPVTSLIYSEDKNGNPLLFSGSEDSSIIQWELFLKENKFQIEENIKNKEKIFLGKPKNIFKGHEDAITSISFDSENNLLISGGLDKKIIIRDINYLNKEPTLIKSTSEILSVYADNKIIISGEKNKKLKFFNLKGELINIEKNLDSYVTCILKLIHKEKNIDYAFGLSNGKVVLYNEELNKIKEILYPKIEGKEILKQNDEEYKSVASLSTDKNGEYLFIGYKNGIIMIYDIYEIQGKDFHIKIKNGNEIKKILFEDKYFQFIFIGDNEGFKIRYVNENNKKNKSLIFIDFTPCLSLCFSNNKNYLFAGFGDGIIRIYRINDKDN